ncbi:MAG TPA: 16S rRNA (guanine(966)-N(2))-methyltransferase RsmD [Humibacter sp.]|nr:16S rRNA (guanine(966)-N(2))-methyltransferase RsmD [Humibacter sp.]
MTRIVAGAAGSLTLAVPTTGTRPTSDRVREAVFSALDSRDLVRGSRVVDLYAGSGALGLEAASRGAASVRLVERGRQAAEVCRRNARAVGRALPEADVQVRATGVRSFLSAEPGPFDLVFADPPYELGEAELAEMLLLLMPRLAPGGTVVVERSSRSPEPAWPHLLVPERRRAYGETVVWIATADRTDDNDQPAAPSQPA